MGKVVAVLVALLVIALLVAVWYFALPAYNGNGLLVARDMAIIFLAFMSLLVVILFLVVAILLMALVNAIQQRVEPILTSAKRTVTTVQGTTTFVTDSLVAPIISLGGFTAAARKTLQVLVFRNRNKEEK